MKKCIVIYNPVSGKKEFESKVSYVKERLIEAGYDVTIKATEKSKHAIKLAKEACEMKYDLMVVSGGDGTIHEIINGISKMEYKPIIGYIPSGTACDLANTLRISKDVDKALDVILNGEVVEMDVVNSNKGYFVYVTAIGTYVDISYVTDSKMKKHLGYLAYIITGVKEFFTIPMMKSRIEHDGGELKGYFSLMMVVNSKRVAGFNIIDKPQLDDGMVDVVLYRYIPFFNNILYFISFILTPKVIPGVRKIRTSSLKIFTDHHHKWNMDGEEANSGNLKLTVEKKAIKILVNPKISKKYFKESYYGKKEN
jgi:diacylglycerol kinase (ATP)